MSCTKCSRHSRDALHHNSCRLYKNTTRTHDSRDIGRVAATLCAHENHSIRSICSSPARPLSQVHVWLLCDLCKVTTKPNGRSNISRSRAHWVATAGKCCSSSSVHFVCNLFNLSWYFSINYTFHLLDARTMASFVTDTRSFAPPHNANNSLHLSHIREMVNHMIVAALTPLLSPDTGRALKPKHAQPSHLFPFHRELAAMIGKSSDIQHISHRRNQWKSRSVNEFVSTRNKRRVRSMFSTRFCGQSNDICYISML